MGDDRVLRLSEVWAEAEDRMGQKAARLGVLLRAGFAVPDGFAVSFRGIPALGSPQIGSSMLPDRLKTEIAAAAEELGYPVAVRSSGTMEDLSGTSFSGLYKSILHVDHEQALFEAIDACRKSFSSEEAAAYFEAMAVDQKNGSAAVLVQRMVDARIAGVLFTANPLGEPADGMVLELVRGSGEALVSGEQRGERFLLDRHTGTIISKSGQGETAGPTSIPESVSRVFALGERIEQFFNGDPQDIEWAVDGSGVIWILQARPITKRAEPHVPDDLEQANDEPFSPLGLDLAVSRYLVWIETINRMYRVRFRPDHSVAGSVLYFAAPWRKASPIARVWIGIQKFVNWLLYRSVINRYRIKVDEGLLRELQEIEREKVGSLSLSDLYRQLSAVERIYLSLQARSYPVIEAQKTAAAILDFIRSRWVPEVPLTDFTAGLTNSGLIRDLELEALRELLHASIPPDLFPRITFTETGIEGIDRLPEDVAEAYDAFVREFAYIWADRYPRDPAWEFDPTSARTTLLHVPETSLPERQQRQKDRRLQAALVVRSRLSNLQRWVFDLAYKRLMVLLPYKETRNHDLYRTAAAIREPALEIGNRFVEAGELEKPSDMFFLTIAEIGDLILNRATGHRDRVIRRKAGFMQDRLRGRPVAERFKEGLELAGEPCSPGLVRGPARVIRGPGDLSRVGEGDVIICRNIRPAWSAVFARAAGLVAEQGSLLSHGAILAREYEIPAVMNVPDLLRRVTEGQLVTVSGDDGVVYV